MSLFFLVTMIGRFNRGSSANKVSGIEIMTVGQIVYRKSSSQPQLNIDQQI